MKLFEADCTARIPSWKTNLFEKMVELCCQNVQCFFNTIQKQLSTALICTGERRVAPLHTLRLFLVFCRVSTIEVCAPMLSMQGKNAVIFGVANKRSIAWAIAQSLSQAGAKLAITYMNERMKAEAYDLIASLPGAEPFQCDVSSDSEIDQLFSKLKEHYGRLDAVAHCIAFAPAEDMKGDFLNTSREGFRIAHDVSAYSLIAVTRAAAPLMTEGGSVITLTYFGAEKVVPGYNVIGVAKASLEATVPYLAPNLRPQN